MKVKNLFTEKKNESFEAGTKRLATQFSTKDKTSQMNQQNVEKRDCSTNVNIRKKILKMNQQTILDKIASISE